MARDRSKLSGTKWAIVAAVVAALWVLAGVAVFLSLRQTSSKPDMVASMEPLPGVSDASDASWSPDGLTILYASYPDICRIGVGGENRTCLAKGRSPIWSPDGATIAFVTDDGLQVMSADGNGKRVLVGLTGPAPASRQGHVTSLDSPAWSPNGSMIAFEAETFVPNPSDVTGHSGTSFNRIWIVSADGSNLRELTKDSAQERNPSWSADSQSVLFSSDRSDGTWATWKASADGNGSPEVTEGGRWSPDGTRRAYVTEEGIWVADGDNSILIAGDDGNRPSWLSGRSESYYNPFWSPDGTMIAFESVIVGPVGNIWIVNADGSGKTKLTRASRSGFDCKPEWIQYKEPRWSPDGTKLLFLNGLSKGNTCWGCDRLWVMKLDTENGRD